MTRLVSPIHLHPTADVADRVLLPGDPGRALVLAQELLAEPKMFNHHRGLWGYTGAAADGEPMTIQATGMGGPSAAIVLEELCDLGVTRAVRVGTCGALDASLSLGDLVVVSDALSFDGASRALGAPPSVPADPSLTQRLGEGKVIASSDLFYDPDGSRFADSGAVAVEMESAALFAVGARRGVAVGCILGVTDLVFDGTRERLDEEGVRELGVQVGRAGARALLTSP